MKNMKNNNDPKVKLRELGFSTNRLKLSDHKPNRDARRYVTIEKIEELDGLHDTFCV